MAFATAAATNFALGLALFGALILPPLYYQLVRAESPLATGLLLAPQGLGAALAMPIAGKLTDDLGARMVVPAGLGIALLGTLAYLQVGAEASYVRGRSRPSRRFRRHLLDRDRTDRRRARMVTATR